MAGVIVIEGDPDEIPELSGLRKRPISIQTPPLALNKHPTPSAPNTQSIRPINGQVNPTISIRLGEVPRRRCLNVSTSGSAGSRSTATHSL